MAKKLAVIMAALLFLGAILPAFSEKEVDFGASEREISYGAMEGDNMFGHSQQEGSANPYNRGCESDEQCRGSRRLLSDMEDAVEGAKEGAHNVKDKVVNLFN